MGETKRYGISTAKQVNWRHRWSYIGRLFHFDLYGVTGVNTPEELKLLGEISERVEKLKNIYKEGNKALGFNPTGYCIHCGRRLRSNYCKHCSTYYADRESV